MATGGWGMWFHETTAVQKSVWNAQRFSLIRSAVVLIFLVELCLSALRILKKPAMASFPLPSFSLSLSLLLVVPHPMRDYVDGIYCSVGETWEKGLLHFCIFFFLCALMRSLLGHYRTYCYRYVAIWLQGGGKLCCILRNSMWGMMMMTYVLLFHFVSRQSNGKILQSRFCTYSSTAT